ncbi:glyoxalase family protein [Xylogone sp. PMI_703]|nr:glyoxalase family protein [Xylogone sp. PMI_703]
MANETLLSSAWKIIPQFPSASITRTVDFYSSKLHFTCEQPRTTYSSGAASEEELEPTFCSVHIGSKSQANIYFIKAPASASPSPSVSTAAASNAMVALGTQQLDEYYAVLCEEGQVSIVEPIGDKPWGYRQFTIADPDGNRLTFFRFLEGTNGES